MHIYIHTYEQAGYEGEISGVIMLCGRMFTYIHIHTYIHTYEQAGYEGEISGVIMLCGRMFDKEGLVKSVVVHELFHG